MTDPTGYTKGYNFANFQANNPTTPLPGVNVDTELAGVATSLTSVIAAVTSIRRSDGGLQNNVVTLDSLDSSLQAKLGGVSGTTTADLDPSVYASQEQAEAGAATDVLMTPQRTAQAITAQRPYATQGEAQAGTNTTAVMTPARTSGQINAVRGFASQVEAEAGTSSDKVMTPERTKQAIDALRVAFSTTADIAFGTVAAGDNSEDTVAVAGAAVGDAVAVGLPATGVPAGVIPVAWVSAADTVTLRMENTSGLSADMTASATYRVTATRQ